MKGTPNYEDNKEEVPALKRTDEVDTHFPS